MLGFRGFGLAQKSGVPSLFAARILRTLILYALNPKPYIGGWGVSASERILNHRMLPTGRAFERDTALSEPPHVGVS